MQLALAHPGHGHEVGVGQGALLRHLLERGIGENDVGRHTLALGQLGAQLAQAGEQLLLALGAPGLGLAALFGLLHALFDGLDFDEAHSAPFEQHLAAGGVELDLVELIGRHFHQALRQHLLEVLPPGLVRQVAAGAVGRNVVVALRQYLLAARAAQHVNEHTHGHLLLEPGDGRERLLRQHRAVKVLGWVLADVAIAAVGLDVFAEVAQQVLAAADRRGGVLVHAFELGQFDFLLGIFILAENIA